MAAAHVKAAAAIIISNGFRGDFSDFAIVIPWTDAKGAAYFSRICFGRGSRRWPRKRDQIRYQKRWTPRSSYVHATRIYLLVWGDE
jgi:hypothetical protein